MKKSTITLDVDLDEKRIPQKIEWQATESTADGKQQAKAFLLSLLFSALGHPIKF
jgi:hypothetical protein